ncbi:hypothetical protein NX794_02860 [Streptomyces sp. LP11]|uniref:Secreted protein n=1 Tax=Streptomyces pyxinicus TaxID=2970331 RepID=A0ABT2AWB7_9ACTN|nr:hypothetical protein [Streptomyces sp. LP11]MCS0600180.1 hypothetical protein [Streptomyces sp. LP11]
MAGTSSGIVAGLTAAAVGAVGFLAFQARATVPAGLGGKPSASASAASKAPRDRRNPTALPHGSGTGERVVYSLDDDRVWLVSARDRVQRTFRVRPGNLDPLPGTYWVSSRSNAVTGSDGVPIEHVVRFTTTADGIAIGFSAAVGDGSPVAADPGVKTGGIRESRSDGDAMWLFATIGVPVVVIR